MTRTDPAPGTAPPPATAETRQPTTTAPTTGRLRSAWRAAHTPAAGVPRWARTAAFAVPLIVLPSGLWRLQIAFGDYGIGFGERAYIVFLSVLSEVVAFAAVGLVATWGERFPRWMPGLRGRRVPTPAAVIPATLGAVLLTVLWTSFFATQLAGVTLRGEPIPAIFPTRAGGRPAAIFYLCYLPLLLWGPLLGAVTYAYHRRRRNH
ncbi:hypothetical protein [Nonomuraea jiangxiensis]|uniref:Uncharacterized protein n=1 Tax=Nonomuraea jiangxiensis TaxID=633440 RepID=A0A1G9TPQ2_9ACTN|nr:hypothetical protein [Nonomuraea jiangxiensis]SDM49737.1 hypothetical protein SAMN05421869_14556 [Nonomuraea jiangxiensis]